MIHSEILIVKHKIKTSWISEVMQISKEQWPEKYNQTIFKVHLDEKSQIAQTTLFYPQK